MNLTQSNLQFAPAKHSDLEQIMMIEAVSFAYPWTEEIFRRELGDAPLSFSYVTRDPEKGQIIAYVFMKALQEDELHLLSIAVDPDWRRQGIGEALIALLLKTGRQAGMKRVTLEVRVSNRPACKLYRKFGFKEVGLRPQYYCNPRENGLVFHYDLVPPALPKAVGFRNQ